MPDPPTEAPTPAEAVEQSDPPAEDHLIYNLITIAKDNAIETTFKLSRDDFIAAFKEVLADENIEYVYPFRGEYLKFDIQPPKIALLDGEESIDIGFGDFGKTAVLELLPENIGDDVP